MRIGKAFKGQFKAVDQSIINIGNTLAGKANITADNLTIEGKKCLDWHVRY